MIRALRKLRDCDRGASVIEMALAAPILATILIGMIDVSRAYSERLLLEQAAQRAIERAAQQRTVSTDYSVIKAEAASAAGITQTSTNPDLQQWLECTPTSNGTPSGPPVHQGNNSLGNQCPNDTDIPSRYVTLRVQKPFTPTFRTRFFPGADANGRITLSAKAGVRIQ